MTNPIVEIIVQVLWLIVAIWFLRAGYEANKEAPRFSLKSHRFPEGARATVAAEGIVLGLVMISLFVLKLFSCGTICWS
jgi:hypothetical protein